MRYDAAVPSDPVHPEVVGPSHHATCEVPSADGVDVSLIRWTLSLTPKERLDLLQANADALARLQDAAEGLCDA